MVLDSPIATFSSHSRPQGSKSQNISFNIYIYYFTLFSSLLITFYIFLETYLDGFGVLHLRRCHLRRFSSPPSSSPASLIAGVANLRCHKLRLSHYLRQSPSPLRYLVVNLLKYFVSCWWLIFIQNYVNDLSTMLLFQVTHTFYYIDV